MPKLEARGTHPRLEDESIVSGYVQLVASLGYKSYMANTYQQGYASGERLGIAVALL